MCFLNIKSDVYLPRACARFSFRFSASVRTVFCPCVRKTAPTLRRTGAGTLRRVWSTVLTIPRTVRIPPCFRVSVPPISIKPVFFMLFHLALFPVFIVSFPRFSVKDERGAVFSPYFLQFSSDMGIIISFFEREKVSV